MSLKHSACYTFMRAPKRYSKMHLNPKRLIQEGFKFWGPNVLKVWQAQYFEVSDKLWGVDLDLSRFPGASKSVAGAVL